MSNEADIDRGDITGALNTILTDPPYGEGVEEAKVCHLLCCPRKIMRNTNVLGLRSTEAFLP